MSAQSRWFLLPGMGADSSMYELLCAHLAFEVSFIDWPKYKGEKTYEEVAKRVIEETDIRNDDFVGGSSLGGMIALEIARLRELKAVILIGSAISSAEVQRILSLLSPIAEMTPVALVQLLIGKHDSAMARMFAKADPAFIRAMCRYLRKWPGSAASIARIYRLHGQKDHVIPCPKAGCEIVQDAGHLIAITHPEECAQILNRINSRLAGS